MKTTLCLALGSLLFAACSKSEDSPSGALAKPEAQAKPSITIAAQAPQPLANLELAAVAGLPCTEVVETFVGAALGGEATDARRAAMLATCKGEWSAPMRACVQAATAKSAPLTCATTAREEECKLVVERLSALAKNEGKSAPSLKAKQPALLSACADLNVKSRTCLIGATTLEAYQTCEGALLYAELAASAALGWDIPGMSSWAWPEYFKGSAAERVATEVLSIGDMHVRPSLRLQCNDAVLEVRIWSKVTLGEDGAAKAVPVRVAFDGGAAKERTATLAMGEHLVFEGAQELAKELASAKSMVASFTAPEGGEVMLEFAVDGTSEALAKLPCGK